MCFVFIKYKLILKIHVPVQSDKPKETDYYILLT